MNPAAKPTADSRDGHRRPDVHPLRTQKPDPDSMATGGRLGAILAIGLIVLAAAFVIGLLPRLRERDRVADEARALAIPTVSVTHPGPAQAGPPLMLSGELRPLVEATIFARASGYVRKWNVDIGATVKQGDVLAELDTPELNRELAQTKAELTQAEAARALAESTSKRWKEMLGAKTVSPQEAEEKAADVDLKRATVEAAKAKVERLEDLFGFTRITAPFAGTVTARNLDVGQLVTEGAGRELFRLAQMEKLRVFVRVPQSYSRAVKVGQTATLAVAEFPGRKIDGKIVRTAGAMEAASRTLLVEIEVDNAAGDLLAGSFARVQFTDAKPDAALTLPSNTLIFRANGPQVAVVESTHVKMHLVTLGRDFGATVEILTGVTPSDNVVLNPADSLTDGAEVNVRSVSSESMRGG